MSKGTVLYSCGASLGFSRSISSLTLHSSHSPQVVELVIQPSLQSENLNLDHCGTVDVVHELHPLAINDVPQDKPGSEPSASSVWRDHIVGEVLLYWDLRSYRCRFQQIWIVCLDEGYNCPTLSRPSSCPRKILFIIKILKVKYRSSDGIWLYLVSPPGLSGLSDPFCAVSQLLDF